MTTKNYERNLEECVFCQIVRGQKYEKILYADEDFIVFADHAPTAPIHLLIVPKVHINDLMGITDPHLRNEIFEIAQKLIMNFNLNETEYTFGFHGGRNITVKHVHAQLIGNMGSKLVL